MVNDHEAHDAGHGSPHEVHDAIANVHVVFAVDRARCTRELALLASEILQANLLAVDSWSSHGAAGPLGHRHEGHDIALGAREQMMLLVQEWDDDLGAGVVGIGHEQDLSAPSASD